MGSGYQGTQITIGWVQDIRIHRSEQFELRVHRKEQVGFRISGYTDHYRLGPGYQNTQITIGFVQDIRIHRSVQVGFWISRFK